MTKRHTPSARGDSTRTHRSQSKPAKAQPILLDRLEQGLRSQAVSLKRAALQSVAAAAFGFHNANEFAAANLVPPAANLIGGWAAQWADTRRRRGPDDGPALRHRRQPRRRMTAKDRAAHTA